MLLEYIAAKARAGILKKLLHVEMEGDELLGMSAPRIAALIRQADSTAKLVVRLADRLRSAADSKN